MSNYLAALQAHQAIYRDMLSYHPEYIFDTKERREWQTLVKVLAEQSLQNAETLYGEPRIIQAIEQASRTLNYAGLVWNRDDFPWKSAFFYCPAPILATVVDSETAPHLQLNQFAFSWHIDPNDEKDVVFLTYRYAPEGHRWFTDGHLIFNWTEPIEDLLEFKQDIPLFQTFLRFVYALLAFLRQSIVLPSRMPVPRAFRRHLPPTMAEPHLLVVLLRKVTRHPSDTTGDPVEWSCRWLVRGHWRQQYYPSDRTHRAIWIDPYVKGPEDKPFRLPDERIAAIVR